jgi:hypothetical protein
MSWKQKGKDELSPYIDEMASTSCLSELRTVLDGVREVATWSVQANKIKGIFDYIVELGLVYVPLRTSRHQGGFTHKFYEAEEGDDIQIFGCIAKEYEPALKFREARLGGDGESNALLMGKLLGYPECCIQYFDKKFNMNVEFDPVWSSALLTKGAEIEDTETVITVRIPDAYPEVNPLLRYFGIRATPHIPCSYKCEESKKFSKHFIKHIKHKELMLEVLENMVWDSYRGIAKITTPYFEAFTDSMPFKKRHVIIIGDEEKCQ